MKNLTKWGIIMGILKDIPKVLKMVFGARKYIQLIILVVIIVNLNGFSIEKIKIVNWKDNHNTNSISLARKAIDRMDWLKVGVVKE